MGRALRGGGLLHVLGCVGDGVDVGIGQVDVREVDDDVEGLHGAGVAVQMCKALLAHGPNSCGIGWR